MTKKEKDKLVDGLIKAWVEHKKLDQAMRDADPAIEASPGETQAEKARREAVANWKFITASLDELATTV